MQIVICIVFAILLVFAAIRNINIIQLQSYSLGFFGAETNYQIGLYAMVFIAEVLCLVLSLINVATWYAMLLSFALPISVYVIVDLVRKSKTPLVVTARVMRYFVLFTLFTLALFGGVYYLSLVTKISIFYFVWINFLLTPLVVRLAFLINIVRAHV